MNKNEILEKIRSGELDSTHKVWEACFHEPSLFGQVLVEVRNSKEKALNESKLSGEPQPSAEAITAACPAPVQEGVSGNWTRDRQEASVISKTSEVRPRRQVRKKVQILNHQPAESKEAVSRYGCLRNPCSWACRIFQFWFSSERI